MLERVFDLYDQLEKGRVMLSFKGLLTTDLVTALLGAVERKMEVIETDQKSRKRVFNVVMECLQNLYHHNSAVTSEASSEERHGVVMIVHHPKGYSVLTGNLMRSAEVDSLKQRLDKINALDADQLRGLYKETLNDGRYGAAGGGGLGIIDIARKSGQKLEYGFAPKTEGNAFFSLNVNVNT
ncbi:MAG: SiaB family protein kinase [Flavobacteriales bacterium]